MSRETEIIHRKLLVIHQTEKIRDVIRRFLAAEMSDISVREADGAKAALQLLEAERFDIVLCATTIDGMDGRSISSRMRSMEKNRDAHFILLISSGREDPLTENLRRSFENYMHIPFTARELADQVNQKVDPRSWRRHPRLHIPDLTALIRLENSELQARVVNISISGMLCDFPATAPWNEIWKGAQVTLSFPASCGGETIAGARYKLLRMNILPMRAGEIVPHVRAAWALADLDDAGRESLAAALERAAEDHAFHAPEGFEFQ